MLAQVLAAAILFAAAGCGEPGRQEQPYAEKPELGLLTTLPIYWNETAELGEMLSDNSELPWPRAVLEKQFELVPLDSLAGESGLASVDMLLLVQPRALSAEENVALDEWVRAGGRAVIFADPLLTAHSRFGLGDRRRPQGVVLLSPILARWGLELTFDPEQEDNERLIEYDGIAIPVQLAGRLEVAEGREECRLESDGFLAHCTIGSGGVTVIADAALFDGHEGHAGPAHEHALGALASSWRKHFGNAGE